MLQKERSRYRGYDSIWTALEGERVQRGRRPRPPGDVRLVSLKWLMKLAKSGSRCPRQELPEEAFLEAARASRRSRRRRKEALILSAIC